MSMQGKRWVNDGDDVEHDGGCLLWADGFVGADRKKSAALTSGRTRVRCSTPYNALQGVISRCESLGLLCQGIREWIPDDDAEPRFDLFDQRPDSGKPVEIPREDGSILVLDSD